MRGRDLAAHHPHARRICDPLRQAPPVTVQMIAANVSVGLV
jgi:hypothetical protein